MEIVNRKLSDCRIALFLMAALTIAWGCSSDNDDDHYKTNNSVLTISEKPTWAVDWTSNATAPDWQEPDASKYECSMNMLIRLTNDLVPYSTDADRMAVFIGGECRGLSLRNKLSNGNVAFLLHVKGNSEEAGQPMELRYYCDGLHHLTITRTSPFVPNNIMDEAFKTDFNIAYGSTKYPIYTNLTVMMPERLPFTASPNDILAVFVGDECRGVGSQNPEYFEGWRVMVFSAQANETAQIRYYSAEKGGVYTIVKTFQLNGSLQQENISF